MGITFVPDAGDVLMCDFTGFQPPEMTKIRRIVILSPRSRTRWPDTYLVVPISKTPPSPPENCHFEFKARAYSFFDSTESVWALGNMVTCVKAQRLDRMKINGRHSKAQIRSGDLAAVRKIVLCALGMDSVLNAEEIAMVAVSSAIATPSQ